jgi:CRP/FNR family cyclic AMP-dependent transcriptional regulator
LSWIDLLGYAASATVLATFCMNSMRSLRLLAIGSNILFILFGSMAHIYPVLLLHVILLPVNIGRLMQVSARSEAEPSEI